MEQQNGLFPFGTIIVISIGVSPLKSGTVNGIKKQIKY